MSDRLRDRRPHGGRALLSALWTYVLLSMLLRDVHELFHPGYLAELVNGEPVDQTNLLIGGILLQVPLALVPLSLVLPGTIARWSNVVGAVVMTAGKLALPPGDADDYVFTGFQLAALVAIAAIAFRWKTSRRDEPAGWPIEFHRASSRQTAHNERLAP